MTKDDVKLLLKGLDIKLNEIADDVEEKVAEWKSGLGTETRRAVRPYWTKISVIAFVIDCGIGHLFF